MSCLEYLNGTGHLVFEGVGGKFIFKLTFQEKL
jgi:hypothetical protein